MFVDELVMGVWDAYPVTEGHMLILPRRHISSWSELTENEQAAILGNLVKAQKILTEKFGISDFNVGFNQGQAAGQTIPHFHLHVIPRRSGDVADPRGGIRYVIPDKANYLAEEQAPFNLGTAPHTGALISGGDDSLNAPIYPHTGALISGGEDSLIAHIYPHIDEAESIDVAISFAMVSGVRLLMPHFQDLLNRNGRLRIITGDYMDVTDPSALRSLMDLEGNKSLFVFETTQASFHPKSWIFHGKESGGFAIVGSSNLSETALKSGVEWNYRVVHERDKSGWQDVANGFETLLKSPHIKPLTNEWVTHYTQRRQKIETTRIKVFDAPDEPIEAAPKPHEIQVEALEKLKRTREAGYTAGLIVLATGLGKTWLSAFDAANYERILFVAHREEILEQAMLTFRLMRPDDNFGRYTGTDKDLTANILFASIQTMGRVAHLRQFSPDAFDYIIIDEFHHAAARTYRGLIEYFTPQFLLGLTATPERTDGGDLLGLCQENLVYRCDVFDGIQRDLLSPFHYFGVPDEVDYAQIPWRGRGFDEDSLTEALATQARAQNALEQFKIHGGKRALGFCCSVVHAKYMAKFFLDAGLRSVAVHSGTGSAPRTSSLEDLQAGNLDVIFAVDMFNEGVDVPLIDTVLMLRPTTSAIIWMQQFGRGLRKAAGKDVLKVVDYIGNHRIFLTKIRALMQLGEGDREIALALDGIRQGLQQFPPGCEITYDLQAIDMIEKLLRPDQGDALEAFYMDFLQRHGQRPLAIEAYHAGHTLKNTGHGSWFGFLRNIKHLNPDEAGVLQVYSDFLDGIGKTRMTRSYKMLLLKAWLRRSELLAPVPIKDLSDEVAVIAKNNPLYAKDISANISDTTQLQKLLIDNPIEALVNETGSMQFAFTDGMFGLKTVPPTEMASDFADLIFEAVDWRLAEYLSRGEPQLDPLTGDVTSGNEGLLAENAHLAGDLWREYKRNEIPPLFGDKFNIGSWNSGVVMSGSNVILLVTLKKGNLSVGGHYEDGFQDPQTFAWQSQNKMTRNSKRGKIISGAEGDFNIHLFVRAEKLRNNKAAPFLYCGAVSFVSWEGENPINVKWRLGTKLPDHFHRLFGLAK
ncbi:MAG: DUF3427 domain-containing protein [Rhodospirillales bacterium]|nr:DUF3427 domain-containing protein [Rhodospirillales bacterium]